MGRYYNGDIEGKVWFAVQSSDDADFFGFEGTMLDNTYIDEDTGEEVTEEANELEYAFTSEHLPAIKYGVAECGEALGHNKEKLDTFFSNIDSYNNTMLEAFLFPVNDNKDIIDRMPEVKNLLEWYARLEIGQKILACVEGTGSCAFSVEL